MGFYNPFSYFIRCFIRLFTKKFFWIILILIILLFSNYYINISKADYENFFNYDDIFSSEDINNAFTFVRGLYNNNIDNYDLILFYNPFNNVDKKYVAIIDTTNMPSTSIYYRNWVNGQSGSLDHHVYYYDQCRMFTGDTNVKVDLNVQLYNYVTGSRFSNIYQNTDNMLIDNMFKYLTNTSEYYAYPIKTKFGFYTDINKSNLVQAPYSLEVINPYFITTQTELETYDFDYLQISGGNMPYSNNVLGIDYTAELSLDYNYKGVRTTIDLSDYINVNNNKWRIDIPYNAITNDVIIRNGESFYYRLNYSLYGTNYSGSTSISGTYNLTSEQENNINEESNKHMINTLNSNQQQTNQKLDEQTNAINNQTNSINNMNNSINNSNVDNLDENTLPSDSTNDITSSGVNGIFTSIYNAFCTGEPVNIEFPIPNTNKSISLSPSYVYDSLSNFGGGFLVTLIQAFWWYLISRFIIKDIVNKMNKIKSGNIENIETSNIRGDML